MEGKESVLGGQVPADLEMRRHSKGLSKKVTVNGALKEAGE